jgi:hypothetical protein
MSQDCCSTIDPGQSTLRIDPCFTSTLAGNGEKASASPANHCPTCGQKGKQVDLITLKAMLDVSLLAVREASYFFCRTPDCPVVYFAAHGTQVFTKDQIRLRVYQKESSDESVLVCYCFYHSPATLRAELLATGATTAIEEIEGGIKASQCACEMRNPQGSCCLGNVKAVVKRMTQAMYSGRLEGWRAG